MNRPEAHAAPDGLIDQLSAIERLNFSLPPFVRIAWVSDRARRVWDPLIDRIRRSRIEVAVHSVVSGLTAATIDAPDNEKLLIHRLASDRGLRIVQIESRHGSGLATVRPSWKRYLVTRQTPLDDFVREPATTRLEKLWDYFKIPICCRQFELGIRRPLHLTEDTIARALNTYSAHTHGRDVLLPTAGLSSPLFALLGIPLVPHASCNFCCAPTQALALAWVAAGRELGLDSEMDAVEEFGQWPLEWSALHGIAEIRTPVFKLTTNALATASTITVKFTGSRIPKEGASGLRFPYDQTATGRLADAIASSRGIVNPLTGIVVPADKAPIASTQLQSRIETAPLSSTILDETLSILCKRVPISERKIDSIYLSNYFNVVRLDDGSTGSCMNYFRFRSAETADRTTQFLQKLVATDPLLLGYLDAAPRDLLRLSLLACVVSALSSTLLTVGADADVSHQFDPTVFSAATSAVVLGFGGYFDYIVRHTGISKIHLSDLSYHSRSSRIDHRIDSYRQQFPNKKITVSTGVDNRDRLAAADIVALTGSALCNGTMEEVLDASRSCPMVIVQGQSSAIYPARLFAYGVTYISTTIKPSGLLETAKTNPAEFRRLLEGGLTSRIYLRQPRAINPTSN